MDPDKKQMLGIGGACFLNQKLQLKDYLSKKWNYHKDQSSDSETSSDQSAVEDVVPREAREVETCGLVLTE